MNDPCRMLKKGRYRRPPVLDSFCIFLFIFFQRTILLQCFSVNLRNLLFREYNRVIHDTGGRYFHAVFCHPRDVFFFDSKIRQGTIQIQFSGFFLPGRTRQLSDLFLQIFCLYFLFFRLCRKMNSPLLQPQNLMTDLTQFLLSFF